MIRSTIAVMLATVIAALPYMSGPASAANQMGYRLLSPREASGLSPNGGTLGVAVAPGQQIKSSGLQFRVLRVTATRPGSSGAQAGLKAGDQIIAADGLVFPDLRTFTSYVGSLRPGQRLSADYIPAGGGPENAQRISVFVGSAAAGSAPVPNQEQSSGLSTAAKVAIGVGAAALFGCYKLGCFSKSKPRPNIGELRPVAR